jgi:uncharacterized protein YkwD
MTVVVMTIITVSALSAPLSTEARDANDIRSTLEERHRAIAETRMYQENDYKARDLSQRRLMEKRMDEVATKRVSHTALSLRDMMTAGSSEKKEPVSKSVTTKTTDSVTKKTQSTQTEPPVTKNEPTPKVVEEEIDTEIPVDVSADDFMSVLIVEIHRLTNIERQRAGLSPLGYDNALATIAKQHSEDMARNNYFSHTAQNGCDLTCRFNKGGYKARAWGENIAWRSSSQLPEAAALAAYFVDGWMNSEGHRRNMLSSNYTLEGVGLARIGNKVYATVNFARPQ